MARESGFKTLLGKIFETLNLARFWISHLQAIHLDRHLRSIVIAILPGEVYLLLPNIPGTAVLAIAIGAIPGALSRYYLTEFCNRSIGTNFPYGTFIINCTGCLLMGFCFTLFRKIPGLPPDLDLLVRTGFLGSFTTFSTYGYDTLLLLRTNQISSALGYWLGSAVLAVVGIVAGNFLAESILARMTIIPHS